ncbi:MAG TPA: hypothetical protein VGM97_06340 [Steroidobacteraceae bacterium]|jgi:hypothetical protein
MKAIFRLVMAYTLGTRILRAFSMAGVATIALSFLVLLYLPQSVWTLAICFWGVAVFFLGSALMPLMFGRMARGRLVRVLPYGRAKLLASVYITVVLVAVPTPLLELIGFHQATNFYIRNSHAVTPTQIALHAAAIQRMRQGAIGSFWLTVSASFLTTVGLYLVMWFITSQRSIAGYVKALLVILFMTYVPSHQLNEYTQTMKGSLTEVGTVCLLFGAAFLMWPRWQALTAGLGFSPQASIAGVLGRSVAGREADLVLGTANPWLLIGAQVVPIAFATTIGFYSPAIWLFYLTIFSTVAGAIACQAAERSRVLWLRGGWSRADLFVLVERSFWRHNSFVLGSLIALMIVIGSYAALPVSLLAAGLPLLLISTVLSTYLGLMVTRSMRLAEGVLAVLVMLALMAIAVIAARSGGNGRDIVLVIVLEAVLAAGALALRSAAKSRWASIDWMLCRPDRALRVRAAG